MHLRNLTLASALLALSTMALATPKPELARGRYLVEAIGCGDCHTPLKMTEQGPVPDIRRGLSGHPQQMPLPTAPTAQGPWLWGGAATNTAFWGPWGVSFAANLTPDKTTGIGNWNETLFINTLRSGKHLGAGRPIMPPMPWRSVSQLTDNDLRAVFQFLMSQPAIENTVPDAIPALH
ncbi:MAG TPA: hypothetical protein VFM46_00635 [Pseudomonadales bacterium]|nr:hypothetical protein [Pseudomonadales bacterium]